MPLAILFGALDPLNLRGIVLCEGFASSALRVWRRELTWESVPLLSHVTMPEFVAKYLLVRGGSAGAGAVGDGRAVVGDSGGAGWADARGVEGGCARGVDASGGLGDARCRRRR